MADYYITATLLNNWLYYLNCSDSKQEEAKQSFLDCLHKNKTEPTEAMLKGIEFEAKVRAYDEHNISSEDPTVMEIGELVKGGLWQACCSKVIKINNLEILLFGYADVIKKDKIYDIKRVKHYQIGKYYNSVQHKIYMLCTGLSNFEYLISDSKDVFIESYFVNSTQGLENDLVSIIYEFFQWLKSTNLFEIYVNKWKADAKERLISPMI